MKGSGVCVICVQVEDQQRAEARKRQETGEEWKQRYFELEGEEWVFKNPLNARLAEV